MKILKPGLFVLVVLSVMTWVVSPAAEAKKPNILVIMSDDVGVHNISAYSRGLVGYQTPNLDRIASEGMMFTDYYAEQSCTGPAWRRSRTAGRRPHPG